MASNILSKFLPSRNGEPSIYETLQLHDEAEREQATGSHTGFPPGDMSPDVPYQDEDLDVEALEGQRRTAARLDRSQARSSKLPNLAKDLDDGDDDVPQSLLIENDATNARKHMNPQEIELPPPVPGPSTRETQVQWRETQQRQQLHPVPVPKGVHKRTLGYKGRPLGMTNPKEQAAWMWANVTNLDGFLGEVYDYYIGHGLSSILLSRVLRLLYVLPQPQVCFLH